MKSSTFVRELTRYIQREFEFANPEITLDWVNTEGWESEIYAYTLTCGPDEPRLTTKGVMRLLTGSSFDSAQDEYQALSLLHRAGYPVPEVFAVGDVEEGFGSPFILMQRIEGGQFSDSFPHHPGDNLKPLRQFVELFRRLHTLDWRPYWDELDVLDPPDQPYFHFDRQMAQFNHYFATHDLEALGAVMAWLEAQRDQVPCERGSVVHYDFHPDNILADADGKLYVVDWTSALISDYRFDLAWTLTLALAYGGADRRDMILNEYLRQMGAAVPGLAVFEAAAITRRLGFVMLSLGAGPEQMGMRPEAVDAMRRDKVPLTRIYQHLVSLTGIELPAVWLWLDKFG